MSSPELLRAKELSRNGNYQEALNICSKFIEENFECYEGYEARSAIYFRQGSHDEALADIAKVIELVPNKPSPYFRRGRWRIKIGDNAGAAADFSKVIELDDGYFGETAYFYRAEAYLRCKEYDKAIEDCEKVSGDFCEVHFYGYERRTTQDIIENAKKGKVDKLYRVVKF